MEVKINKSYTFYIRSSSKCISGINKTFSFILQDGLPDRINLRKEVVKIIKK